MFKGINAIDFSKRFKSNEDCYQYLMEQKWEKGFKCLKCGGTVSIKGRTYYYRRCQNCRYDESVLANTLFHDMRIPVIKAFYMLFRITTKKKGMSTVELAQEVGVTQRTAWLFKRKVQVAMNNTSKLKGEVDVDETLMGFHTSRQKGGRNLEEREALLMATEILPDGRTGNIALQCIENFKAMTLKPAIQNMISPDAAIRTDNYCSYRYLQRTGMNIQTQPSQQGKAFEQIHRQIMLFKNWIVGTHHRWSEHHLSAYADEYTFRFNRRNARKQIFHAALQRIFYQIPHPYAVLKAQSE
jgi:hypothetical protein